MNTENTNINSPDEDKQHLPESWGALLALGMIMIILGAVGLGMSVTFTITTVMFFGFFILLAGLTQLVHAFVSDKLKSWKSRGLYIVTAVLYTLGGLVSIFNPVLASIGLTIMLAGMFLAVGIYRIKEAIRQQNENEKWMLMMFTGVTSLVFAIVVTVGMPWTALWVIGLMVAIELAMNGALLVGIALEKRAQEKEDI